MGVLSDFVIADKSEAEAIGASDNPSSWPTLTGWRGIESIKLSTLYCSITGETYTNDLQKSFSLVGGDKIEGPWVFLFPEKVKDCFAKFNLARLDDVAKSWTATEEMKMDRWNAEDAGEFIKQITEHAKSASEQKKITFLVV